MHNLFQRMSVLAVVVCVAAQPVSAQIEKGDKSLALQGLVSSKTGGDSSQTLGMVLASLNFFQTRNFAWRVSITEMAGTSGGETSSGTLFGGGVEWNFNQQGSTKIPFVAFDASYFLFKDFNVLMVSPSAGARFFLSRSTSFDVAASYNTFVSGEDTGGGGLVLVRLGFSYYFGKDTRK